MRHNRTSVRWHFDLATRLGNRQEQQDRAVVLDCPDQNCSLVALADGLGGQASGARAAEITIQCAREEFSGSKLDDPAEFLNRICYTSHERIRMISREDGGQAGSTCVLLLLTENQAHWVHVGDSRLYHFNGNSMVFRTRDHSLAELKQAGINNFGRTEDSNRDNHLLYMCLGGNNDVRPEYGAKSLTSDDWFLLCSDGIWSGLQPWEMTRANTTDDQPGCSAMQLAEIAIRRNEPSADNASIILAIPPEPISDPRIFGLGKLFDTLIGRQAAH